MTTAVIVQARWGSSRLPGKVMRPLGEATALRRVLDRCARIPGADVVVCAVPDSEDSDPVAKEAARAGAVVVRGSERDVLARYAKAATHVGASTVIRVTSDCPFIDPALCGRVLTLLEETAADYACNSMPPSWPHGLDCEAFPARLLHWACNLSNDDFEREHVTPWINRNESLVKATLTGPGGGIARMRWTLDYPEDYAFAQAVYEALGERAAAATAAEIAALVMRRPDIPALNAMRHDEARLASPRRADMATPPLSLALAA
jgi:spore coat polysaccharide biosynthesis protein SpsF (cytidylyltransferase family)